MEKFDLNSLKQLYIPPAGSHKGQNGKLLIIGGSHLFHASFLWSLTIASRIVDMVFYSSVPENNQIVAEAKREFRNGIVVPRDDLDRYCREADVIVIGPGMLRAERETMNYERRTKNLKEINKLEDEGEQSYFLTKYLLEKYSRKKWVIDAGALQMMKPEWILPLNGNAVITPNAGEFKRVFVEEAKIQRSKVKITTQNSKVQGEVVCEMVRKYNCIILLKGHEDVVCSKEKCIKVAGGNAGMTKGGTGDVLAGLVGALACKNDLWLAATCGSYINKSAGDSLFEKVGYYFNASDLADEIPRVMGELLV